VSVLFFAAGDPGHYRGGHEFRFSSFKTSF
jgi:hypothetical protein